MGASPCLAQEARRLGWTIHQAPSLGHVTWQSHVAAFLFVGWAPLSDTQKKKVDAIGRQSKESGVVLMCLTRSVILTGTCQCVFWVLFALDLARAPFFVLMHSWTWRVFPWKCLTLPAPFRLRTPFSCRYLFFFLSEITSRAGRARWQRCWCTGFPLLARLRRVPLHLSSRQHLAERESNVGMNVCFGTANHHSSFVAANQHTKITKFLVYVFSFCLDPVVGPTDMTDQALYFSCMMSSGCKYFILNS